MVFKKGNIPWSKGKKGLKAWNKGIPMSEEQKKKLSEKAKGHIISEEAKRKIGLAHIGNTYHKGKKMSESAKQKISAAKKGRKLSEEHKKKIGLANRGQKRSPEQCKMYSLIQSTRDSHGEKNGNWKGGISYEPYCPKFTREFKERVRAFFNHTCQLCGHKWQKGERKLAIHHVNFDKQTCCNSQIPLFVPLCNACHGLTQGDRDYYKKYFTNLINEKYNGKCYIQKQS